MAGTFSAVTSQSTQQKRTYRPATLLITTESLGPINGVTTATTRLLAYLDRFGIEPVVLAPESPRPIDQTTSAHVVRVPGHRLPYNPELRIVSPGTARKALQSIPRPQVLYAASPASLGYQVWSGLRVPTVVNYQTDLSAYARLMLPKFPGALAATTLDRITAHMFRHPTVKTILCPSRASQHYLESIGIPAYKIRRVGRGVDCQLFSPTRRNPEVRQRLAPNGEVLLLCVSRLSLEKNFAFLARAFRALCDSQPSSSPRFRLIVTGGNANPTIERKIQALFAGLDVVFTGVLTGTALAEMYASADVFVFPSVTETFGQVIQEAMASALPVVALNKGGPADLVQHAHTGYLCSPNEPQALADFVQYTIALIESPDGRAAFGQTALNIARDRDWESVNAQIWQTITSAGDDVAES